MAMRNYFLEVRYVDDKGKTHKWSHHRSRKAADIAFREPLRQCGAAEVLLVDTRSNVLAGGLVLERKTR